MKKEQLKKKLHEMIDKIEDEETLNVLKEDMEIYQKASSKFDDLSDLTDEERAELEEAANEDPKKNSVSYDEFKKMLKKWL
jgi:hypothetical protein